LPKFNGKSTAGDSLAREMPGLASMHAIFVREHNRICTKIQTIKPLWNDERIYQEARRIVGAEFQSIVYREYLPILLGQCFTITAYGTTYQPNMDPSVTNEFATAAFRFGHSMIQGTIGILSNREELIQCIALRSPAALHCTGQTLAYRDLDVKTKG
jgi:peroxidase